MSDVPRAICLGTKCAVAIILLVEQFRNSMCAVKLLTVYVEVLCFLKGEQSIVY